MFLASKMPSFITPPSQFGSVTSVKGPGAVLDSDWLFRSGARLLRSTQGEVGQAT